MNDLGIATPTHIGRSPARFTVGPLTAIDRPRTNREPGEIPERLDAGISVDDLTSLFNSVSNGTMDVVSRLDRG